MSRRFVAEIAGAALLLIFGALALYSMRHKSLTWDEPTHYSFGARMLRHQRQRRVTLSSMAISQLNAAANFYLRGDRSEYPRTADAIFTARLPTVLAGVILGALVFAFARRLYGGWAGLASLALFCFSPTVLAHTRWVTNDIYCSLFMVATLYSFWRYLEEDRLSHLAAAGFFCGMAQISKFTSLLLVPILFLLWAIHRAPAWRKEITRRSGGGTTSTRRSAGRRAASSGGRLALFGALVWLVMNAAYYFQGTGEPWRSHRFQSGFMRTVQSTLAPLPSALPSPYLQALDITFRINTLHSGRARIYMLGETSREGFSSYFLVALAYKVPLGVWALVLGSAVFALWPAVRKGKERRWGPPSFQKRELFLVVPALFLLVYFVFFCTAQIGIRYLTPLLVLLFVFSGRLWSVRKGRGVAARSPSMRVFHGTAWACVVLAAITALGYYPHFLSYFNELVTKKKLAYRILADSNLDWRQNENYLQAYMRKHGLSRRQVSPPLPAPGVWIVSANELAGIHHPAQYRWLRNLEPIGHIAYSHFIFRVDEADLRKELAVELDRPLTPVDERRVRSGLRRYAFANTSLDPPACEQRVVPYLGIHRICGRTDGYSARFEGYLRIPADGKYLISLGSDDGSRLLLDGQTLIDLWSDHGLVYNHVVVDLRKGLYPLRMDYYERSGAARLSFRIRELSRNVRLYTNRLFFTDP